MRTKRNRIILDSRRSLAFGHSGADLQLLQPKAEGAVRSRPKSGLEVRRLC